MAGVMTERTHSAHHVSSVNFSRKARPLEIELDSIFEGFRDMPKLLVADDEANMSRIVVLTSTGLN